MSWREVCSFTTMFLTGRCGSFDRILSILSKYKLTRSKCLENELSDIEIMRDIVDILNQNE